MFVENCYGDKAGLAYLNLQIFLHSDFLFDFHEGRGFLTDLILQICQRVGILFHFYQGLMLLNSTDLETSHWTMY